MRARTAPTPAELAALANGPHAAPSAAALRAALPPPPVGVRRGFASFNAPPKRQPATPRRCAKCESLTWATPQALNVPWGSMLRTGEGVWSGKRLATGPYLTRMCMCDVNRRRAMLAAQGTGAHVVPNHWGDWAKDTEAEAWVVPIGEKGDALTAEVFTHPALSALYYARTAFSTRYFGAHDRASLARWITAHEDDSTWVEAVAALSHTDGVAAGEFIVSTREDSVAWFDAWTVRGAQWECLWARGQSERARGDLVRACEGRMRDRRAGHVRETRYLMHEDGT